EARGGVGEEGRGRQRVAELLLHDRQLDLPELLASAALLDEDPGPPQLGHLAPDRVVVLAALRQLAQLLRLEAGREELARRRLDRLLVVGVVEVHRSRGRPSTRSATMFLRISVVPPSIEFARARRKR